MENETTENVTATLEEDYRARTPRSQELFERARKNDARRSERCLLSSTVSAHNGAWRGVLSV